MCSTVTEKNIILLRMANTIDWNTISIEIKSRSFLAYDLLRIIMGDQVRFNYIFFKLQGVGDCLTLFGIAFQCFGPVQARECWVNKC